MRKLAAVLLLAIAAQCQTTSIPQVAAASPEAAAVNAALPAPSVSSAQALNTAVIAATQRSLANRAYVAGSGRFVPPVHVQSSRRAVPKPMKASAVDESRSSLQSSVLPRGPGNSAGGFDAY